MKQVIAVVRPAKREETLRAMSEAGVSDFIHFRVLGRGQQRGLRYGSKPGAGISFLPKHLFLAVVEDSRVQAVMDGVTHANRTGHPGDGRIFVLSVAGAEGK